MHVAQKGEGSPYVKTLADLRLVLAGIAARHGLAAPGRETAFALGDSAVDAVLGGGLSPAALHEIHAPWADWSAAAGFGLALAVRAAPKRPLLWARPDFLEREAGRLNGIGLAEFGVDPALLSLVRGCDAQAVLRAGVEAARCKSLGAVLIEINGALGALNFAASLRLARAAEKSGVTLFLLRVGLEDARTRSPPSAAASRWRARACPSRPLAANAPGAPGFQVTLLRHRGLTAERSWRLEWLRDRGLFHQIPEPDDAALPRALPALPADGAVASVRRRAG
jgi:protein ImuA